MVRVTPFNLFIKQWPNTHIRFLKRLEEQRLARLAKKKAMAPKAPQSKYFDIFSYIKEYKIALAKDEKLAEEILSTNNDSSIKTKHDVFWKVGRENKGTAIIDNKFWSDPWYEGSEGRGRTNYLRYRKMSDMRARKNNELISKGSITK